MNYNFIKMNIWLLLLFINCLIQFKSTLASKSHPVTTFLNAKWYQTPICLEIAEYLSDENPSIYWDYVDRVNELKIPLNEMDSDLKQYKSAVRLAEKLIGGTQSSMLKVSLAMHAMSPRVQAHFQIAQEVIAHGDCNTEAFVTIGNKVACNMLELENGLNKQMKRIEIDGAADNNFNSDEEIYSFDHVYPNTENNTITVVVYSELGTKISKEFHEYLKKQISKHFGKIKYISRHFIKDLPKKKVRLSGYGVELFLKSTEYKSQDDSPRNDEANKGRNSDQNDLDGEVDGFDFKTLKERFPSLIHSLNRFKATLLEKTDEIAPLKAWEFQELGLQAAQRIAEIQGEESLQILQFTSQNFPTQAKSLLHVEVNNDFRKEMSHNIDILARHLNIQPPDAALFVNGLYFDAESLDISSLLETLRTELRVLDGLYQLNIEGTMASDLLALDLSSTISKDYAIDIRDSAIIWINDLETDAEYRRWPSSVLDLMRPTFPGMLRNVRKNLFNLILLIDPVQPKARDIIKLAESFVIHTAPVRLGIVFDSRNIDNSLTVEYQAILCAFNYITQEKSARFALGFLTDIFANTDSDKPIKLQQIQLEMKKMFGKLHQNQIDDILGADSDFDYGRQVSNEFLDRLGKSNKSPQAMINGVPLQQSLLTAEDFEETILTEIMQQTPNIQKAVYKGELTDNDDIMNYLMQMPHVMPRLNQRILNTEEPTFLDMYGTPHNDLNNLNGLINLSARDMTATLLSNIKYFYGKHSFEKVNGKSVQFLTIWVITDLNTLSGVELLYNALQQMLFGSGIRVAFIPNVDGTSIKEKTNLNRLIWAASQTLSGTDGTQTVLKWLKSNIEIKEKPTQIPTEVNDLLSSTELHLKMLRVYCQRVLNLKSSESAIITNGHLIGPLNKDEIFTIDEFSLIDRFVNHQYCDKIREILKKSNIDNDFEITSDSILKLITILVPRQQNRNRFVIPNEIQESHTVVRLPQKHMNLPYFDIFAVLDPASRGAQKLSPILILLRNIINCNMRVVMAAVDKHSDMPVKSFYRFVIEHELQFTSDGKARSGPYAKFTGIPASPLLTQNVQVPENWMVEVVRSVYDLDNIKLEDINGPVHSEYELEHLLLEGHCFDSPSGTPPRGLQFTLGTKDTPIIVDTIVMANLGYFQLKANPGAWLLKLRHGKSDDIYEITSADGPNTIHNADGGGTRVIINSLRSHVLKIRVAKKPGMTNTDLLADDDDDNKNRGGVGERIWDSITSSFIGNSDGNNGDSNSANKLANGETINIFSVASGHLYERLLRIMMLSLLKHTKSPVKFWFLKNYLSPQFIDFLPHMAKEYSFQYELVQYKWPRWLHQQTEKQRIIWGYKILFLDVLFPLDIKKIIFVDADAIVRADIKELNDLFLNGAPYAYTPFCDSRKEMEGFRFWKQGYWRTHLQQRKYHISALYVVDLKKFRKIAAGDRLRGQYQALSQDPNSLSNLDQDLPNNMIYQVAIKSLPQDWLWCQTWCSDATLSTAKVIDLCNNPQTKEAKLTAAQRIVPEWTGYDSEIKNLINRVDDNDIADDNSDDIGEPVEVNKMQTTSRNSEQDNIHIEL